MLNGRIELTRKEIEYGDAIKYGDMFNGISKRVHKKTIIGIAKCNVRRI
jgi:hypothetical protein